MKARANADLLLQHFAAAGSGEEDGEEGEEEGEGGTPGPSGRAASPPPPPPRKRRGRSGASTASASPVPPPRTGPRTLAAAGRRAASVAAAALALTGSDAAALAPFEAGVRAAEVGAADRGEAPLSPRTQAAFAVVGSAFERLVQAGRGV